MIIVIILAKDTQEKQNSDFFYINMLFLLLL